MSQSDEMACSVSPQHPAHITIIAFPRPRETPLFTCLCHDSFRGSLG